jgi:hypothetical protein
MRVEQLYGRRPKRYVKLLAQGRTRTGRERGRPAGVLNLGSCLLWCVFTQVLQFKYTPPVYH